MGEVVVLVGRPWDSNQMLPVGARLRHQPDWHARRRSVRAAARHCGLPRADERPSTPVHNEDGTLDPHLPRRHRCRQFNTAGPGDPAEADRNGNTTSYAYVTSAPPPGQGTRSPTRSGWSTTLAWPIPPAGLSTVTDPADRATTFTVDSNDNLTSINDPDDAVTQYGYFLDALQPRDDQAETDPDDNTATVTYNSFGQVASETLFDGTSSTEADPRRATACGMPGARGACRPAWRGP